VKLSSVCDAVAGAAGASSRTGCGPGCVAAMTVRVGRRLARYEGGEGSGSDASLEVGVLEVEPCVENSHVDSAAVEGREVGTSCLQSPGVGRLNIASGSDRRDLIRACLYPWHLLAQLFHHRQVFRRYTDTVEEVAIRTGG
jgi:hypothetical protein